MAIALAPFSQLHFQSLPSLNTAKDNFAGADGDKLVKEVFTDFFINNGMDQIFGLAMLHRHFDLAPGEIMVNYNSTSTAWSATPGPGMDEPQPTMWDFTSSGKLIPTEFRYAKGHRLEMGEKELAFAAKFKNLLEQLKLTVKLGLVEYPGDDYEGSCEITMGQSNINLKPGDFPDGLVQTDTAWFFSPAIRKRGCRCTCDSRTDPHGHGTHVITQSA